ncbi:NACHT domain-containing protein [Streptomyces actuosus]|uniref:NACHT domain-containing protein n=1 Tax=Streptomyces actuosus TaxID=1885 RepID=A0ABS2VWM3_STRAS|nr:NACHT domain-containing protein [Streptomyces actuosus]MBN0047390.1 NACHT domain-containing protein [Streptomyces actuosus]
MVGVGEHPQDGDRERHPELDELADWFAQAVENAGYRSPGAVVRAELAHENVVLGIADATKLFSLPQVKSYAVALGRDAAEVAPLWFRAKAAMDRAAEAGRQERAPRLTSWTELPRPTLALRTLLEAQTRAMERLPYDLLGVEEPPLSAVYVRQQVRTPRDAVPATTERRGGEPGNRPETKSAEPGRAETRLPVPEALARHEHLLITGEPGAGKSTLTSHLARTLARIWLRDESSSLSAPLAEPVLPVRIAAHTLTGDADTWSATLDRAVRRSLGPSLIADPAPWLFQGRVSGARWLVLLDGLDEITDHESRKTVIKAIAQHARAESVYRFVITSRPLPDAELSPLRSAALGEYALEPFGPEELREFAAKWFATQFGDERRARAATDRFLQETEDSRLRELVQNPLLATIAAVNATVSPDRRLPTNRVSLYRSFFARLLTPGTAGDRTGRVALRRRLRDDPDRLELHLWLDRRKPALLRMLGRHRLDDAGPLLDGAVRWVRENAPAVVEHLAGWEDDLPDFLRSTGLLVSEQDGFRFLHHSFAEYFAAEAYAEQSPSDFPDAESWFWRAFQDDDQTLSVFVLCLWAKQPGNDPDLIAERLRSGSAGGYERPLLGGVLLAEGVRFGEAHTRELIESLLRIGCCTWQSDVQEEAFSVLGSLAHLPVVAGRLERIARTVHLPIELRLLALQAFSLLGRDAVAEEVLTALLGGLYRWLDRAARIAAALGPGAKEAVRRRARELMDAPGVDPSVCDAALKALVRLDMFEEVTSLAGAALVDPSFRSGSVRQITDSWLTAAVPGTTHDVADAIVAAIRQRPVGDASCHVAAGRVLEKYGEVQAAAGIARGLLAADATWTDAVAEWAADTLVKAEGENAGQELAEALGRSGPDAGHYPWVPARLHSAQARLGAREEAGAWAREMLARSHWSIGFADRAVGTWLTAAGPPAVEDVMRHTDRGRLILADDRPDVAQLLSDAGARDEADEIAELSLRTPFGYQEGYETAARLLIKNRGITGVELLPQIWKSVPGLDQNSNWLLGVSKALPDCKEQWDRLLPVVSELARELVALPAADGGAVLSGLRLLFAAEGTEAVPFAVRTATRRSWLSWWHIREIAAECAAFGRTDAALTVWRFILTHSHTPYGPQWDTLTDVQSADAGPAVAALLRELLADDTLHPPRRLCFRQLLACLDEASAGGNPAGAATP